MSTRFLLPLTGMIALGAGAASAQLVSQRVEGNFRFCRYRPVTYATPSGFDAEWRTPANDVCPSRYPGLDGPDGRLTGTYSPDRYRRRREAERPIPAMAMLASVRRTGSRTVCVYAYAGNVYRYVGGLNLRCPLTPHFLPPGRANPDE